MATKTPAYNIQLETISNKIFSVKLPNSKKLNETILDKFQLYKDNDNTRKTHLFEGRYENIYISSKLILETNVILSFATQCVQKITERNSLKSGLWFNYMEPGHITLPHSHDDADEVYSAVYYVKVPNDSGDLIINDTNLDIVVKPKEGMLVLFPPNLVHHVTKNNSSESRLSLGMNIGD